VSLKWSLPANFCLWLIVPLFYTTYPANLTRVWWVIYCRLGCVKSKLQDNQWEQDSYKNYSRPVCLVLQFCSVWTWPLCWIHGMCSCMTLLGVVFVNMFRLIAGNVFCYVLQLEPSVVVQGLMFVLVVYVVASIDVCSWWNQSVQSELDSFGSG